MEMIMDAWSTVLGQRTMESIISIARDMENIPTLRDKFAMSAMNVIVNDTGINSNLDSILGEYGDRKAERIATAAYKIADAMLNVRKEK